MSAEQDLDRQSVAALVLALAHLCVDTPLSIELEDLSGRLWRSGRDTAESASATQEWAAMLRSRFAPRSPGPAG